MSSVINLFKTEMVATENEISSDIGTSNVVVLHEYNLIENQKFKNLWQLSLSLASNKE